MTVFGSVALYSSEVLRDGCPLEMIISQQMAGIPILGPEKVKPLDLCKFMYMYIFEDGKWLHKQPRRICIKPCI